ncbi:holo-ACP synthase [bacterium]|nr:holo-ACP synthase [bacterium]
MIIGIGFDQTELARIRAVLARHGDRFLKRCYTEEEMRFANLHHDPVPRLAARYAAKEAGSKALGTGIARGILWKDIEIVRAEGERPYIHFHGRAAERAQAIGMRRAHVSITHARDIAAAIVIIEK